MSIPINSSAESPDLAVFRATLVKARENRPLNQEVHLSQFIVPTAAEEVARARQLHTRVDSDPDFTPLQLENTSNPLTLSPKGPSPRFSDEWYNRTAHLHPASKLQVQKAPSKGNKE